MIQSTFTRQKRELAKATALLKKLRAMETRLVTYAPDGQKIDEIRETYVDFPPEEIAAQVFAIAREVVGQHGARQQGNSVNTGRFQWQGVEADLTVPQLRALQEAHALLSEMANLMPRQNPRLIPNTTVDGRPAYAHPEKRNMRVLTRYVPYESSDSNRVRTYEEHYEELESTSRQVTSTSASRPSA